MTRKIVHLGEDRYDPRSDNSGRDWEAEGSL